MSKTTDEIIAKLLRRVEAEEQANACLECDLEYAEQQVSDLKTEIRMFKVDIDTLKETIKEREEEIKRLKTKYTETILNKQVIFSLVNFVTKYYGSLLTVEGVEGVIKCMNANGFLNYHAIVNKIYDGGEEND